MKKPSVSRRCKFLELEAWRAGCPEVIRILLPSHSCLCQTVMARSLLLDPKCVEVCFYPTGEGAGAGTGASRWRPVVGAGAGAGVCRPHKRFITESVCHWLDYMSALRKEEHVLVIYLFAP